MNWLPDGTPDPAIFHYDHPSALNLDLGWRRNDAGVDRVLASLPHPGELAAAAPHWMGDGLTGDLMPYLAYYGLEIKNPDGSLWKEKDAEPPYIPQVGNNCTSRGMGDGIDLLQCIMIADPEGDETIEFQRICIEAVYAFGLHEAGMRGDGGCYGGAIAKGVNEIGCVPYAKVDGRPEETRSRLVSWANDPGSIVEKFRDVAAPFKAGSIARVTTWEELCAAVANKRIVTMASNIGYVGQRDSRGIIRRRGSWNHQMFIGGVIRSDGVETAVQFQSWGKSNPEGPQPFHLPSFAWRCVREDVESQLRQNDCWAVGLFPGFEKKPLPHKWTNAGWAA